MDPLQTNLREIEYRFRSFSAPGHVTASSSASRPTIFTNGILRRSYNHVYTSGSHPTSTAHEFPSTTGCSTTVRLPFSNQRPEKANCVSLQLDEE